MCVAFLNDEKNVFNIAQHILRVFLDLPNFSVYTPFKREKATPFQKKNILAFSSEINLSTQETKKHLEYKDLFSVGWNSVPLVATETR
jgi:hypothetical protein